MIRFLAPFAPLFSERVFRHAQVLLAGTILAPGKRTVSSALRAMGLGQQKCFHRYHRVLSHASWSSVKASRILLRSLVEVFVPEGDPLVVGIDETLERRYGKKIYAKGIYRDPVRSTHENFVKSSGLRWVCVMLLAGGLHLFVHFCSRTVTYAADRGYRAYATPGLSVVDLTRGFLTYRFPTREEPDMVRVLVTVEPRMYREAIALAVQRNRPEAEVMLVPEEILDGQVGDFAPHVLVRNDKDGVAPEELPGSVVCCMEVLYTDGMAAQVSVGASSSTIEDASIDDLLALVDKAE